MMRSLTVSWTSGNLDSSIDEEGKRVWKFQLFKCMGRWYQDLLPVLYTSSFSDHDYLYTQDFSHYTTLEVSGDTLYKTIWQTYRDSVFTCHPDKQSSDHTLFSFHPTQEEWQVVCDPGQYGTVRAVHVQLWIKFTTHSTWSQTHRRHDADLHQLWVKSHFCQINDMSDPGPAQTYEGKVHDFVKKNYHEIYQWHFFSIFHSVSYQCQ